MNHRRRSVRQAVATAGMLAVAGSVVVAAAAAGNHGKVGATVTVKGQSNEVLAVSVGKISDPLLEYGADPGMRVIGVNITVKNVGKAKYDDSPSAFVSTADGQISASLITSSGPCDSPSDVKLAAGQSKTFCLPFQVPRRGKLVFIQYNVDSGYGTPAVFAVK